MRIGIDAHAAEREGSGNCTYIRNLLKALGTIDNQNEYVLYVTDPDHPFYQNFYSHDHFKIRQLAFKSPFIRIPLILAWKTLKDSLDILHVQYIAPPFHSGKLVTTVHDLGFLHYPQFFPKFEVFRSKILIRFTAKRSDDIITGSHFSKNDIMNSYRINPNKIEVIPLGVSSAFIREKATPKNQSVQERYGIESPYILCVGRLNPRKNLMPLVEAFVGLKRETSIPHKLIIAGKGDFAAESIIQSIKTMLCPEDVWFIGFVADQDLPSLYNGADVFIYPSLFEGFGLPILEAMSCGTPVIAAGTSGLIETVGDAGLLVNPLDPKEIKDAVLRIISDQDLKKKYIKRGLSRAKKFTWLSAAQKTLNVYKRLHPG